MNQALHHHHTAIASAVAGVCPPRAHSQAPPLAPADIPSSAACVYHLDNPTREHADNVGCSVDNNSDPQSMASYKELLAQKAALETQIASARKDELSGAVDQVRTVISEFGLTEDDVFGAGKAKRASKAEGTKVAVKYRDPATGVTWTGRGRAPLWIADKDRAQFVI